MQPRLRGERVLGPGQHARVGLLHHLLAEVHTHQVVLEDVVIEHVLGSLAQVDDPLRQVRWPHAKSHVLGVARARRVVVAADSADPAGDRVGVARVFPLHEHAVTAEDRRRAMALDNLPVREIDLGVDAQAPDHARDRVPRHLDESPWLLT